MEPAAEGIRNSHEHSRRPGRGGDFPDAYRMEAMAGNGRFQHYMLDFRQLGKRPPLVVDQVRIEDVS